MMRIAAGDGPPVDVDSFLFFAALRDFHWVYLEPQFTYTGPVRVFFARQLQ
jgi:hypothetical protein